MAMHTVRRLLPTSAAILILGALAIAGPLDPPDGPVSSTFKTLGEVEPRTAISAANTPGDDDSLFRVTQPGSYYLTGSIVGEAGKHGIEIAASGVTVDLMGFDLQGAPGSLSGVFASVADIQNVAVANGSARDWDGSGVDLNNANNTRLSDLSASGNGARGIYAGENALVTGCNAHSNTGIGIEVVRNGSVANCFSRQNGGAGIVTLQGCVVWGCGAFQNDGDGIVVNIASTVTNCSSRQSGGNGVTTQDGCIVSGCTLVFNTLDGVRVTNDCIVRGNACRSNGFSDGDGAGIHLLGSDNRVEENNCADGDRGVDVDAADNFILRNTCSGNTTNWDVVAGNNCLVVLAVDAGAILGDSGGTGPGSADPNANFTY